MPLNKKDSMKLIIKLFTQFIHMGGGVYLSIVASAQNVEIVKLFSVPSNARMNGKMAPFKVSNFQFPFSVKLVILIIAKRREANTFSNKTSVNWWCTKRALL